MAEKKGHGSAAARTANAKAAKEGKSNPRTSSSAQAELGKKGGKAAAKKGVASAKHSFAQSVRERTGTASALDR